MVEWYIRARCSAQLLHWSSERVAGIEGSALESEHAGAYELTEPGRRSRHDAAGCGVAGRLRDQADVLRVVRCARRAVHPASPWTRPDADPGWRDRAARHPHGRTGGRAFRRAAGTARHPADLDPDRQRQQHELLDPPDFDRPGLLHGRRGGAARDRGHERRGRCPRHGDLSPERSAVFPAGRQRPRGLRLRHAPARWALRRCQGLGTRVPSDQDALCSDAARRRDSTTRARRCGSSMRWREASRTSRSSRLGYGSASCRAARPGRTVRETATRSTSRSWAAART